MLHAVALLRHALRNACRPTTASRTTALHGLGLGPQPRALLWWDSALCELRVGDVGQVAEQLGAELVQRIVQVVEAFAGEERAEWQLSWC